MDIAATRTGRLLATELDTGGLNFRTAWSDNEGVTWTPVNGPTGQSGPLTGTGYVDQDRQYLAVGLDDPTSHLPRVYMLQHNLASGSLSHNMWVATSTDNGTSFGPFIPTTLPGQQAYEDLQCADSGGPSNLFVNPRTGRVYAVYGTRSSTVAAAGGCGASGTGTFEINIVAATRVWISSAAGVDTADPTKWTQSLAVDDDAAGLIVGMQLAPGAIDQGDNVFILYPESPQPYPNYDNAAIKFRHATESAIAANPYGLTGTGPANQIWSAPVTVAPAVAPGNLLPHIVAGGPGQIDMAWFEGRSEGSPAQINWYAVAAQSLNALSSNPSFEKVDLARPPIAPTNIPAYSNQTASLMMGACSSNGVQNGFACNRSTDIWAIALDNGGNLLVAWPGVSPNSGTFVQSQVDGQALAPPVVIPEAPFLPALMLSAVGALLVLHRRQLMGAAQRYL